MLPSLQYQMTDSEEIKEAISQQKEVTLFGGNYHIDQIRHQLKVIVPLSVITTENGPTCFMLGSNRIVPSQYDYYLRKFQAKYYKDQKDPTADVQPDIYDNDLAPESIPKLEATNEIVLVTGGPGDLVLFDTRTFHKASAIKEGTREVLWMYF
jgi:ectoine hydroxylase-related dioxygenase (phytanoyl-CoA dioxygenase family)